MTAQVIVGGVHLSSLGVAWGDVEWIERLQGGCWEASWAMALPGVWSHPSFRSGVPVSVILGGATVWSGYLSGRDGDKWTALGWSRRGDEFKALAAAGGVPTTNPAVAVQAAIARGLAWEYDPVVATLLTETTESGTTDDPPTLTALLDAAALAGGWFWGVDAQQRIYVRGRDVSPSYVLGHGVAPPMGVADDDFVTHLIGIYTPVGGGTASVTQGDLAAAARWGRREETVDLRKRGQLTSAQVANLLAATLDRLGPRPGFTSGIELSDGDVVSGGSRVFLPLLRPGRVVKANGTVDEYGAPAPFVDFVVGETRHSGAGKTAYVEPLGLAARNLSAALEALAGGGK